VNDVQAAYERPVTQLEQQKVGHRWISITDVDPSYQESFLAASAKTLKAKPDAIRRFLIGYVKACKYIADANGKWTPDMIAIMASGRASRPIWSRRFRPRCTPVNTNESRCIARGSPAFLAPLRLVPTEQPIGTLIDTTFITAAQKAAGVTVRPTLSARVRFSCALASLPRRRPTEIVTLTTRKALKFLRSTPDLARVIASTTRAQYGERLTPASIQR